MGQVRVFKSSWFQRFANKERIDNTSLQEAVNRAESGLVDANIGGGVIKQRIGRKGKENRAAIARSFCFGKVRWRSSFTASPRATRTILESLRKEPLRKLPGISWH